MLAQSLLTADNPECFGTKVRQNQLLYRRSFSLSALANVQVDLFFAKDAVGNDACQSSDIDRSPLFGGAGPCWSSAKIPEMEEDDDSVFAEMITGSDEAEHLASVLLERHVNSFIQWVVVPVLVVVCLLYAFMNAPVPAKAQLYRSVAATFCLLVGFGVQCCFVSLFAPDVS